MKRLCLFLIISVFVFSSAFAQNNSSRPDRNNRPNRNNAPEKENRQDRPERPDRNQRRELKSVTIEGTLQLEKGFVAVASGDVVYYVPMLTRYIGFIDGLKEGTKVSVEGIAARNFIHPTKVTIEGKSYDFIARGPGFMNNNFGPGQRRGDFGPGRGMQEPNRRNTPGRGNFGRGGCCGWV